MVQAKLVLVRIDDATAVAYANHGADRSPDPTRLARAIKGREIALGCTAVAPHIAGRDNAVADSLSRFSPRAIGGDPYPDRDLRTCFRAQVEARCWRLDADTLATDDSRKRGGLPLGAPYADTVDLALGGYGVPERIRSTSPWDASFAPKGGDGAGCPLASRRTSHGRSGFPDLAHSGWHGVLPPPLLSFRAVRVAIQFPAQMKKMSIGSRCM